jgi:multidrug efflux system outer membrane protein
MVRLLITCILLVFTSGCLLRAHYRRPKVDAPVNWRISADESSTIANVRWWEQFKDPVLDDLIQTALDNNNDLGIAVGRVYEFMARFGIARSYQLPEVDGTGAGLKREISANRREQESPSPKKKNNQLKKKNLSSKDMRTADLFTALLNLTFYVDIWGKIQNEVDATYSELIAQVDARRSIVLTVVSEVAATYVLLRQYDKQLEIAAETYNSRFYSYKLFKLRYEGGLISEMEVKQAEAEALDALVEVKKLQILIPQTENQLSILLGYNPGPIPRGLLLENFQHPPEIPAGLPSDLLEQRPDILQAEALLMATNSRVAEAKANFFPQINLTANYGNQSFSLNNLFTGDSRTWLYGVEILQQIFNAGRIGYEVEIEKARRMQALYNYYLTIQKAFREVDDALVAHQISLELKSIGEKEVEVLKVYLHLANLQYDNGQTDYLNVLDAERRLFAAQLQLVQFQAETINSLIELYAALGGGWVVDADADVIRAMPDIKELRCFDLIESW